MKKEDVLALETKEASLLVMRCTEEILDVMSRQHEYTSGDLQSRVMVLVLNILRIGSNLE